MDNVLITVLLALLAVIAAAAAVLTVRGYGVIRIGWLNFVRLKELDQQKEVAADPALKKALDAVIDHCQALRCKWILKEEDLNVGQATQRLVQEVAAIFHPQSTMPLAEARLGSLLDGFLELKQRIRALSEQKGVRALTQFRLRHVLTLSKAWQKKEEWQRSAWGQAVSRYRLVALFRWVYYAFRFMDITFWVFKMLGYIVQDVVLKVLLLRWYLTVGELAIRIYSDRAPEPDVDADDLLQNLGSIADPKVASDLPEGVREIADASRKELLFNVRALQWHQVREIYFYLVEDIGAHYFPEARQPRFEVKLYDLMLGVSRLSDEIGSLRNKPVAKQLLQIRLSHLLLAKDAVDYLRDSELLSWLKKYPVHRVMKLANLIYQTLSKKHPGLLLKDVAFFLVKETGKRWLYVYLHDRIALEANHTFKESSS